MRGLGRWSYLYQNSGTMTASEGKQGYGDLCYHGTVGQLYSGMATGLIPDPYFWKDAAFSQNPYQATTNTKIYTVTPEPQADRIFMESCSASLQIMNPSTIACEICVYWCLAREQSPAGPSQWWTDVLLNTTLTGAGVANNPSSVTGAVTSGAPNPFIYGQKPEYERTFGKRWAIMKKRCIILQAGSSHDFKYTINYNKFLDRINFQGMAGQGDQVADGITLAVMMIVKPTLVVIREGGNVPGNDVGVSTGTVKIGWGYTHRYKFKALESSRVNVNRAGPNFVSEAGLGTSAYEAQISVTDTSINPVII